MNTLTNRPGPVARNTDPLRTVDLRDRTLSQAELKAALPRAANGGDTATRAVEEIIDNVRRNGLSELSALAARFDGAELEHPRVPDGVIAAALDGLHPEIRAGLETSINRVRAFAEAQRPADVELAVADDAVLRQRWVPVRRVGLYVPGGLAVYPSSVLMNVVPAQAAGVESIALASPPQREFGGWPHPTILAAAALLGITEVYAIGGAQAIAAFAYGVPDESGDPAGDRAIAAVDVVTGPGNVFVATAKRLVKSVVGIDAEAGTTEIAVIADDAADPELVAADLISQAEHDPHAASVLITDSPALAARVQDAVADQASTTKHHDRVATALAGPQSGVVLVTDLDQAVAVADAYAAEHLEVQTRDAAAVAGRIRNAGAIFIGPYSPVSLGDYCAGSNHVLPTGGTAAHASGLNTTTFLKAVQVVHYGRSALEEVSGHIERLAEAEDLPAHGDAVSVRFQPGTEVETGEGI